jgi:hypothetical protein
VQNKNECLSDSTYFEIDLSFLSQDIEKCAQARRAILFERRAAHRRFAPIGQMNKTDGQRPQDLWY